MIAGKASLMFNPYCTVFCPYIFKIWLIQLSKITSRTVSFYFPYETFNLAEHTDSSVFELYKQNKFYNYVITLCDEANSDECVVFPRTINKIHWSFKDPASFKGSYQERLAQTRQVRDEIKEQLKDWLKDL